jgi:hypothetical protein
MEKIRKLLNVNYHSFTFKPLYGYIIFVLAHFPFAPSPFGQALSFFATTLIFFYSFLTFKQSIHHFSMPICKENISKRTIRQIKFHTPDL